MILEIEAANINIPYDVPKLISSSKKRYDNAILVNALPKVEMRDAKMKILICSLFKLHTSIYNMGFF